MNRLALFMIALGLAFPAAAEQLSPIPRSLGTDSEAGLLRLEDRREYGPELLESILSPDPSVRSRAALAAGRIGDPEAIEPLAGLLADADRTVRNQAAFALGEIEDTLAVGPLALLLRQNREADAEVRATALEALAKTGSRDVDPLIVAGLADPSHRVREAACLTAWQLQVTAALDRLILLSGDPADDLRWKATYSLMRMLGAAPSGRTAVPGGIVLTDEERASVRDALLERVDDSDVRTRLAALRGLAPFTEEAVRAAVGSRLEDPDWRVRVQAIQAWNDSTDAAPLAPMLEDPNPNVRITAIEALGRIGSDEEATRLLTPILESDKPRNVQVAVVALAQREDEPDPALARRLARSTDWQTRAAAAALVRDDVASDSPILRQLLHDDPRVAKLAVEPLISASLREGRALDEILADPGDDLESLLSAPDPILRALTIDALGRNLPDTVAAAQADRWVDFLAGQWRIARDQPGNDVAMAILPLLERHAEIENVAAILSEASRHADQLVAREARRILAGERDAGPIETGRSIEEYETILRWAREDHEVEIVTERGTIRIGLYSADAPLTCWNFTRLAESGFYDGGVWHRIVPNFVVQDGCPRGDGWGGPGYQIRCEINRHGYETGTVGMALSGKDTGGSQFFITHSPQPHLDGRYTVFGRVIEGQEIVDRLIQGDRIERIRTVKGR